MCVSLYIDYIINTHSTHTFILDVINNFPALFLFLFLFFLEKKGCK